MKRKIAYIAIMLIQLSNLFAQDKNKQETLHSNSFIKNTKIVCLKQKVIILLIYYELY